MVEPATGPSRANGFVIVCREKPKRICYIRDYPRTAVNPTENQIIARIIFGEVGRLAKGIKNWQKRFPMPPAAILVKKAMEGLSIGRTRRLRKWEIKLLQMAVMYAEKKGLPRQEVVEKVLDYILESSKVHG